MCAAQYKDCPDSIGTCKQLCDALVPSLSAGCQDDAKTFYDCGAGIEWTCQGMTAQQKDPNQCSAESDAYVTCLSP
jgi:hypothetical protein